MSEIGHIDNAINQNKLLSTKMQSVQKPSYTPKLNNSSDSYNGKVIYYNDEKTKKKSKTKKALIVGFGVLTTAATILTAFTYRKNIGKGIEALTGSEFFKKFQSGCNGAANTMSNFTNIKDDAYAKVEDFAEEKGFKWLKKAGAKVTDGYKWCIKNVYRPKYKAAIDALEKSGVNIKELGLVDDFDKLFEEYWKAIYGTVHKSGNRVTDGLFTKDILKKVTQSNIADGKLAKSEELKKLYEKLFKIDLSQMDGEKAAAAGKFNEVMSGMMTELEPKLRDMAVGSAPTDILTILGSMGMLGGAVAMADCKEEKKSIVINLGIPLTVAMGSTMYGVLRCLSGAKALIFGLVTGQIASSAARSVDKMTSGKQA